MEVLAASCPLCGGDELVEVFALHAVPVLCNQLWPDAETAKRAPVGDVDLVLCGNCALIFNRRFEPAKMAYAPGYENALHFSPTFQAFAEELAATLVSKYGLAGKRIVEIGCGDGHMLELMVKNGVRSAVGFDPSMAAKLPAALHEGVEIVPEYFRADRIAGGFDAVLCRHVLEHLPDPVSLLSEIRQAIGTRFCPVYFEVPNAQWMLDSVSMWDVIYEHVTYWTEPAIRTLFRRTGFEPVSVGAGYGGQFLMVEAVPAEARPDERPSIEDVARLRDTARSFADSVEGELRKWQQQLDNLARNNGRAVIWGAGSKGITFANIRNAEGRIVALVDINARKHGMVAPRVALPVVAPDELRRIDPGLVLISNGQYQNEIQAIVADLGLNPSFAVLAR